jgi:hypothetical protein
MRVIVARSNSFIPFKCKKSIHVVFHYHSPETARPSSEEIFAKQCFLDFVWLALPFAGMVAFTRSGPSAAEFAPSRRFKFQKSSELFIRLHGEALSVAVGVSLTAKFVFAGHISSLDSSERSADVAKWQTQRT